MKIYHYTNINSLALILKNRTIRFNRLDSMDDLEEIGYTPVGVKLGQYMFVSCWTDSNEEDISQWSLYGNKGKGVRIELDSDMFVTYSPNNTPNIKCSDTSDERYLIIPLEKVFNANYMLVPISRNINVNDTDIFFRKVKYVNNTANEVKDACILTDKKVHVKFNNIGKFKHKRWEFQQEVRFSIIILPNNGYTDEKLVQYMLYNNIKNNISVPINEYFLQLKDEAISNITIRLGPSCEKSDEAIVESLMKNFVGEKYNKIEHSTLKGYVKIK